MHHERWLLDLTQYLNAKSLQQYTENVILYANYISIFLKMCKLEKKIDGDCFKEKEMGYQGIERLMFFILYVSIAF